MLTETSPPSTLLTTLLDDALRDGALYIDNSFLEGLTTCPRALFYSRIAKRIKAGAKPALNFGSAIHLALEHRYRHYANITPDPMLLEEQAKILTEYFATNPPEEGDYRTLNWAIEIVRRYNARYELEPFQLLQNSDGKVLVELPFAVPLFVYTTPYGRKIPVIYTGRIDLPVLWDDQVTIMDHKTTSMLGPQFSIGMQLSAQQRGYCWAYEKITGQKVGGYVANAIRVKEPPMYLTDPNSTRRGKSTVESWWNESFVRERFFIRPGDLEEWESNVVHLVQECFHHLLSGYMPMKTAWCNKFGQCQYFDICTLPREDRGILLQSGNYMDNTWDPLKDPVTGVING